MVTRREKRRMAIPVLIELIALANPDETMSSIVGRSLDLVDELIYQQGYGKKRVGPNNMPIGRTPDEFH